MKKSKFHYALIAFLLSYITPLTMWAQEDNIVWKKNFGGQHPDGFGDVIAVSDGIIAVGSSWWLSFGTGDWTGVTGRGGTDAIIVKYDSNGNVVWKKHLGSSDHDYFHEVTEVSDGIVVVGDSPSRDGDWSGVQGMGRFDATIVKYSNSGSVIWKKRFGGIDDDDYYSVTTVSDGVVAVGSSGVLSFVGNDDWAGVSGKGGTDAIIVKYDNNGNVVWKKNFGGNGGDEFRSVVAVDGGVIVVGSSSQPSFNNGDWEGVDGKGIRGHDAIIVKYDNNGNVVWKKNFGGSGDDEFISVAATLDGIIVVGHSHSESFGNGDWTGVYRKGNEDAIIVKYSNDGDVVWKKNFGGSDNDEFRSVVSVEDGIITVGYSGANSFGNGDWTNTNGNGGIDAFLLKYDNNGNIIHKQNFGGNNSDWFFSVVPVLDGVVAVGSSKAESFGNGDWINILGKGYDDAIIVKFSTNGLGCCDFFKSSNLSAFPNPTKGRLRIESNEAKIESVEVFDIYGRKLLALLSPIFSDCTIDISHLSAGIYFVRVSTDTGVVIKKVLKE